MASPRGAAFAVHVDDEAIPDWLRDAVIYEVFVDRFAGSDGAALAMPASPGDICGGTLAGVRARLDHIAALGVTCLWLTPIFPSPSHHGYDASDYLSVEPRLGTVEDLAALVADAHARGIRVLLDFVVNHVSSSHAAFGRAQARPRAPPRPRWFRFTRWPDEYDTFFGVRDHPRIDSDDPGARRHMIEAARLLARRRRRRLPVRLRQRPLARVLERVPRGHARRPAGQRDAGRGRRDPGAPADLRRPARRLPRLPADAGASPVLRLPGVDGRRARRVPAAAPRVLRRRAGVAVVPRQPRHEPLPVGRRRRHPAAPARRDVPVRPPRSADRVLRHRARPLAAPRRALRGRERPPRGVEAPDAVGRRGRLAARVLRRARPAAARHRAPVAPAARGHRPRRRGRRVRLALRRRVPPAPWSR